MLNRLWDAFRYDRWLQIAVLAFVTLFIGFQERLMAKEELYRATDQLSEAPGRPAFNIDDRGPFIVELPAPPEVATQVMVAQLSGRAVHVKDQNGEWHRMRPVIGPNGEVQDHSDTIVALAKAGCSTDSPAEIRAAFQRLNPSTRAVLCELAGVG